MSEPKVKRGTEFTHPNLIEPGFKVRPGKRHLAPRARCVVTATRGGTVWFRPVGEPEAESTPTQRDVVVTALIREQHITELSELFGHQVALRLDSIAESVLRRDVTRVMGMAEGPDDLTSLFQITQQIVGTLLDAHRINPAAIQSIPAYRAMWAWVMDALDEDHARNADVQRDPPAPGATNDR